MKKVFKVSLLLALYFIIFANQTFASNCHISNKFLVNAINNIRVENGLKPLKVSPLLELSAQIKAEDMVYNHYWAHISPSGITPWDIIRFVGYNYKKAGENLAKDYYCDEERIGAWMNSPSHKAVILSTKYKDIGIARYKNIVVMHAGAL